MKNLLNPIGAIVIGGHFQGLGVVRALARKNLPVVLIDHEKGAARFSRYVQKFYPCPPVLENNAFFDFLVYLADQKKCKGWVVFPTDDETVRFLSIHRQRLLKYFHITTPKWNTIQFAYNKIYSYKLAEKIGIPIPKTWYPVNQTDLENMDFTFPVIVKPAVMRNFFRKTNKKVLLGRNRNELIDSYQKACKIIPPAEILIQEQLPDVTKHLYSFCPFFKNKRVMARVVAQRIRQHPMDFGHATTYAITVDQPELEMLGSKFLSAIDYYGLCEVEFIQDPRDQLFKFLEVNPRIWGWHTLAVRAGVNLPYLVYSDMLGREMTVSEFRKGIKWMRMVTDLPTSLLEIYNKRMNLKEYWNSLKGEKECAVLSLHDPLPFIGELLRLPYLWKTRGF